MLELFDEMRNNEVLVCHSLYCHCGGGTLFYFSFQPSTLTFELLFEALANQLSHQREQQQQQMPHCEHTMPSNTSNAVVLFQYSQPEPPDLRAMEGIFNALQRDMFVLRVSNDIFFAEALFTRDFCRPNKV